MCWFLSVVLTLQWQGTYGHTALNPTPQRISGRAAMINRLRRLSFRFKVSGDSPLVYLALQSRSLCVRSQPVWCFWCRSLRCLWSSSAVCPEETSHRQSCPCTTPLRKKHRRGYCQYVRHKKGTKELLLWGIHDSYWLLYSRRGWRRLKNVFWTQQHSANLFNRWMDSYFYMTP